VSAALHAIPPLAALLLAPLLLGVVSRTKAIVAGRRGPPLLQLYFDLAKLLRKGAVYSTTATWLFRLAPVAVLASSLLVAGVLPLGGIAGPLSFPGDLVLVVAAFAFARASSVLAALDVGSSFEAMGASREVQFATFAEPALLLGLGALARSAQHGALAAGVHPFSLAAFVNGVSPSAWLDHGPVLALLAGAFVLVHLAENCRVPVDDPNTHLELTMIHEVMVLDHSGPDLAFLLYGAAVKFWLFASLVVDLLVPVRTGSPLVDVGAALLGTAGVAVVTGLVESGMARLRLNRVPQLLVAASALSALAAILTLRGGAP
jgi:formate hydrogenlyase subunit 4